MLEKNIEHIMDATGSRLVYHSIELTDDSKSSFYDLLKGFTDEDFDKVTDELTEAIYKFLISLGVPDLLAYRCSWKWSD